MARYILLTIIAFVALTFLFVALKGILRRLSGVENATRTAAKGRVLYNKKDVVVLQGEAEADAAQKHP